MAKPILVVGLSKGNSPREVAEIQHQIERMPISNEYYVLPYRRLDDETTFEVFYEKDFNEVKYEELKQLITDKIKNV